jgi:quinol monooxygenase YgiN
MALTNDDRENIYSIKSEFDNNVIAEALSEQAVNYYLAAAENKKDETYWEIKSAAGYVRHVFHANAFTNDGSLDHWFELPSLGIPELARRQGELHVKWDAEATSISDEEYAAIEVELDRVSDLENEGFYGRTVAYTPEMKDWIYIRFGKMPKAGKSVFGLMREDNEDGVDPWRQELGNMTHEAGVCVFKAYRHPDVPDAFILIEPHFELARYNVSNAQEHLLAIIPEAESISDIPVLRIRGDLTTIYGRDRTLRADLGSDGEYLINSQKPFDIEEIDIARIWASSSVSVSDLLHRYRRVDCNGPLPWHHVGKRGPPDPKWLASEQLCFWKPVRTIAVPLSDNAPRRCTLVC